MCLLVVGSFFKSTAFDCKDELLVYCVGSGAGEGWML